MASQTSFKQQCPSCETMVPIKDASLVGKKVDCPKCKYRFVVEDPGEVLEDGPKSTKTKAGGDGKPGAKKGKGEKRAEAGAGKGKSKPAEKKGGSKTLILGVGLGLVAVIALVVGILFFTGVFDSENTSTSAGGSSTASTGGGSQPARSGGPSTPGSGAPTSAAGGPAAAGTAAQQPAVDPGTATASNLLPNDTQVVYSLNVPRFIDSTLGGGAFRSASGYQESAFRDGLGVPLQSMERFLRAESLKNRWTFNVIQTRSSFKIVPDVIKAKLGSAKGPKSPIQGHEYFVVTPNEVLDSLAALNFAALFNPSAPPAQLNPNTLAWHLYNDQILIVADLNQMEQFLQSGRQPAQRTQSAEPSVGSRGAAVSGVMGPGGPMGGGAMGGGPMGGAGMALPGGPAAATGGGPMGGAGMALPGGPAAATGGGPGGGPMGGGPGAGPAGGMAGMAGMMGGMQRPGAAGGGDTLFTDRSTYLTVHPDLKRTLDRMEEVPQSAARQAAIFSCAGIELESVSTRLVDTIRAATTLGALIPLPTVVTAGVGLHTFSEDERLQGVVAIELKTETDAKNLNDKLQKDVLPKAAQMLGKWLKTTFDTTQTEGTQGNFAAGPGGMTGPGGMGGPGGGMAGMMGGMQQRMAGMMGGMSGGMAPPTGGPAAAAGGGARPGPGAAAGGGDPDVAAGGAGAGAARPGAGGAGSGGGFGTQGSTTQAKSFLWSFAQGKVVYVAINAEIVPEADQKVRREVEQQSLRLKGTTEVAAMTAPRWHELARTAVQAKGEKRVLQGTFPLSDGGSGAVFVTRPPTQRVGWMADLLPYLGRPDVRSQIDTKLSWRDERNLPAGANWVPQFLNPSYPRSTWQAQLPSLPGYQLGATHYTGLSGIGLDAAELPDSPEHRKRLGLFGYDRPTNLDDVPDGLSNTIYMITVKPGAPRPWIAGGGATIQGVPETSSLAPFVHDHGGKRGAYVLMADGSVRFLKHDTSDGVFKALVTKAGGDDAGVLEAVAPKQAAVAEPEKPKAATPAPSTAASPPTVGDWKEYVSKEGRYSVLMPPGSARDFEQQIKLANVTFTLKGHMLEGAQGTYGVFYNDYPETVQLPDPDKALQGSKTGMVQMAPGTKVTGEKKITVNGHPGLELVIEDANGGAGLVRLVLANRRIYIVLAGGRGKTAESVEVRKLIDSFKITS